MSRWILFGSIFQGFGFQSTTSFWLCSTLQQFFPKKLYISILAPLNGPLRDDFRHLHDPFAKTAPGIDFQDRLLKFYRSGNAFIHGDKA